MRATVAKINVDNLYNNYQCIKRIVGSRKILGVVKANAYGHGIVEVSRYLQEFGIDYLAVAFASEGVALRQAGINVPILVMVPENGASVEAIVNFNLDCAIDNLYLAKKISDYANRNNKNVNVHIYVDTGMGRDGIPPEDAVDFASKIFNLPKINPIGIMSHFASSDSDKEYTQIQFEKFQKVLYQLASAGYTFQIRHIANTGALFTFPESFLDAVRPGLALYGYTPVQSDASCEFKPVMEIVSKVVSLRRVKKGESVGYGRKFVASEDTTIATVPIGYGDGLPRIADGNLYCLIEGKRHKVVGGICMDEIMVDVGNSEVKVGDEVVILGKQGTERITGKELAEKCKTIVYEVVTSVSARVPKIYVENGKLLRKSGKI
jgi:alanine racemase